jgi:hypothetical protein
MYCTYPIRNTKIGFAIKKVIVTIKVTVTWLPSVGGEPHTWAGVDPAWEQKKLKARVRETLVNRTREASHTSTPRCVRRFLIAEDPICFHRGLQILRLFHKILFLVFP